MSARVLVQSAQKKILIQKNASFCKRDLVRLVAHEIDVHTQRAVNGSRQQLLLFQTGLPDALATEEGLAMLAEQKRNAQANNALLHQTQLLWAIDQARNLGFRPLFERLKLRVGPQMSWLICLRIKRGLAQPNLPGVYAKDSIYLVGWKLVRDWLNTGNSIQDLYVGSVGIHHPIKEWYAQGWVSYQDTPKLWFLHNYASTGSTGS